MAAGDAMRPLRSCALRSCVLRSCVAGVGGRGPTQRTGARKLSPILDITITAVAGDHLQRWSQRKMQFLRFLAESPLG